MKFIFAFLQYLVPQQWLSRLLGSLADSTLRPIKNTFILIFIKAFKVDMSEAQEPNPRSYPTFNAFFTRLLQPQARPLCSEMDAVACPADGTISQLGDIEGGQLYQAKGKQFDLTALLGGDEYISQQFIGGKFATIYLSPKDYHRVHMPMDGQLQTMIHVPGKLFSVNNATTQTIDALFARNERVVTLFDTSAGPMAVVLVGAMIVASIETSWHGVVTPIPRKITTIEYPNTNEEIQLSKGDEMGLFKLGSTAIVLFGPDMAEWQEGLQAGSKVRMGERLGSLINV
ncbi:archaetidylserine decarboxylase [Aurantivibrio plasticivorans]